MTGFDALCWAGAALLGVLTFGCLTCSGLFVWVMAVSLWENWKRQRESIRRIYQEGGK